MVPLDKPRIAGVRAFPGFEVTLPGCGRNGDEALMANGIYRAIRIVAMGEVLSMGHSFGSL